MFQHKNLSIRTTHNLDHQESAYMLFQILKQLGCQEIVYLSIPHNIRYKLDLINNFIIMLPETLQYIQQPQIVIALSNQKIKQIQMPSQHQSEVISNQQSYKHSEKQRDKIEQKKDQQQIPNQRVINNNFQDQRSQGEQNRFQMDYKNQSQNDLPNNLDQKNQQEKQNQQQQQKNQKQQEKSFDSSQFQNQHKNNDDSQQAQENFSIKSQENPQQKNNHQNFLQKDVERQKYVNSVINSIYAKSSNLRKIDEHFKKFIQEQKDQNELFKEYGIKQLGIKNNLKTICNGFIQVRGDGNCFYTAFGFQFLKHLLITYNDDEFNEFIHQIKSIKLRSRINIKQQEIIQQEQETTFLNEFIYQLQQLRIIQDIQERYQQLKSQFQQYELNEDGTGFLYTLSTIFFRNLSDYLVENNHQMKELVFDQENLLIWEQECNNNEVIINELAQYLKISVILIFFDNGNYQVRNYQEKNQNKIILLIRPGHYNIGLKNDT